MNCEKEDHKISVKNSYVKYHSTWAKSMIEKYSVNEHRQ